MPDVVNSTGSPGGGISVLPVMGACPRSRKNSVNVVTVVSVSMAGDPFGSRQTERPREHIEKPGDPFGRRVVFGDGVQAAAADELAARAAAASVWDTPGELHAHQAYQGFQPVRSAHASAVTMIRSTTGSLTSV